MKLQRGRRPKVTKAQALAIRERIRSGETCAYIAKETEVGLSTIYKIVHSTSPYNY